ncbi:hypothetical protein EX30DRAFT_57273 [Ascodesmis nigricans]|uniref:Uncharacterized protein n=1 Tax=Ascodesmis nigricans TaxID=341454 RepID=A0A4S2MV15_9PEZI|nr:hypothetical protein EX30DRAFT_57273 [Ascodesmis nigricans]
MGCQFFPRCRRRRCFPVREAVNFNSIDRWMVHTLGVSVSTISSRSMAASTQHACSSNYPTIWLRKAERTRANIQYVVVIIIAIIIIFSRRHPPPVNKRRIHRSTRT